MCVALKTYLCILPNITIVFIIVVQVPRKPVPERKPPTIAAKKEEKKEVIVEKKGRTFRILVRKNFLLQLVSNN